MSLVQLLDATTVTLPKGAVMDILGYTNDGTAFSEGRELTREEVSAMMESNRRLLARAEQLTHALDVIGHYQVGEHAEAQAILADLIGTLALLGAAELDFFVSRRNAVA